MVCFCSFIAMEYAKKLKGQGKTCFGLLTILVNNNYMEGSGSATIK